MVLQGLQFVMPTVLREMEYADKVTPRSTRRVSVDVVPLIQRYFTVMSGGMAYQASLAETTRPERRNLLSADDLAIARRINAMGFSDLPVSTALQGIDWSHLASIPLEADLFASAEWDLPAARTIEALYRIRGIKTANATKLLHLKRPALFPILDDRVRRALGLAWTRGESVSDFLTLLRGYREILDVAENRACVDWIVTNWHELTSSIPEAPTRVRIIDLIAWTWVTEQDERVRKG